MNGFGSNNLLSSTQKINDQVDGTPKSRKHLTNQLSPFREGKESVRREGLLNMNMDSKTLISRLSYALP